jgi:hypothetical protein
MLPRKRLGWALGHLACGAACAASWQLASSPRPSHCAAPPNARWVMQRHTDRSVWAYDLASRRAVRVPNPLPRLGPVALAPGFDPNFWAMADDHRVKIISLKTGEAVANFEAPVGGVARLCWLDDDRLAVVARTDRPWLIHQLSTGKRLAVRGGTIPWSTDSGSD